MGSLDAASVPVGHRLQVHVFLVMGAVVGDRDAVMTAVLDRTCD